MLNLNGVKGFLIDFDGTLVDTEPFHFRANSQAFLKFGHSIDETEYYLHWSMLGEGAAGEIRRNHLDPANEKKIKALSRQIFEELIRTEPIPVLSGAKSLLHLIPELGFLATIASNTPLEFVRIMMERTGLISERVGIFGSDEKLRGKPFPDIFIKAAGMLNLKPSECLAVEDTWKGLASSMAAGSPCVVIPSKRYPHLDLSGAMAVYSKLDDFLEDLRRETLHRTQIEASRPL